MDTFVLSLYIYMIFYFSREFSAPLSFLEFRMVWVGGCWGESTESHPRFLVCGLSSQGKCGIIWFAGNALIVTQGK